MNKKLKEKSNTFCARIHKHAYINEIQTSANSSQVISKRMMWKMVCCARMDTVQNKIRYLLNDCFLSNNGNDANNFFAVVVTV